MTLTFLYLNCWFWYLMKAPDRTAAFIILVGLLHRGAGQASREARIALARDDRCLVPNDGIWNAVVSETPGIGRGWRRNRRVVRTGCGNSVVVAGNRTAETSINQALRNQLRQAAVS